MHIKLWDDNDTLVDTFDSLAEVVKFIDGYVDPPYFTIEITDGEYCTALSREAIDKVKIIESSLHE